ncbi:MAG: PadR family transcriptional regulator [Anaerolineae bacterium]|nr:PadR family transcriptional regulator [Anaerolineae bacterium]
MAQLTPDETILGLLAVRPGHGYQLLDCFRDPAQLGEVWKLSTSQLYAVLKRLKKQGDIVGEELTSVDAPSRIEYHLTDQGRERLRCWLHLVDPSPSIHRVRVEFLSRLYVARLMGVPTYDIVRTQKIACQRQLTALRAHRDTAEPGIGYLTIELVIAQLQAVITWIDRCEVMPRTNEEDIP